jgi:hypothetical protein
MTTLLDQVPAAIGRVQREIVLARFLGKLAVDQGVREVRQRIESLLAPTEPTNIAGGATHHTVDHTVDHTVGDTLDDTDDHTVDRGTDRVIDSRTLALADYDHLPASDIVSMLAGLEPDERDAIEAYELQGRHRRTILGKLAQLREA